MDTIGVFEMRHWFHPGFGILLAFLSIPDLDASCAPQCVAHARQQSGIYTNRVGRTGGAVDWFERAAYTGDTKTHPGTGLVSLPLVLGRQTGINPRYGHVLYVADSREIVRDRAYQLRVSHANFDAQCSTEHVKAYYFPADKEIEFLDGYFAGRTFSVLGFITR